MLPLSASSKKVRASSFTLKQRSCKRSSLQTKPCVCGLSSWTGSCPPLCCGSIGRKPEWMAFQSWICALTAGHISSRLYSWALSGTWWWPCKNREVSGISSCAIQESKVDFMLWSVYALDSAGDRPLSSKSCRSLDKVCAYEAGANWPAS